MQQVPPEVVRGQGAIHRFEADCLWNQAQAAGIQL